MPLNPFDFLFYQGCGRGKDKDGVGDVVGTSDRVRVEASDLAGHPWLEGGAMAPFILPLVTDHKGRRQGVKC